MSTPERAAWRATLDEALARYHALPRAGGDAWQILEGKLAAALARQQAVEARLALTDDEARGRDGLKVDRGDLGVHADLGRSFAETCHFTLRL